MVAPGLKAGDQLLGRVSLIANPLLFEDNDTMGVRLIPSFDFYPAISTVFVAIVIVISVAVTIIIAIAGIAKERGEAQCDAAVMAMVTVVRIGGRGHAKGASRQGCGSNK